MAIDKRFVFLLQFIARMGDAKGDVTIIGEQQKPRGLPVESSYGNDPLGDIHQVHYGPSATLVARGGDVSGWFVQQDVASLFRSYRFTIHGDPLALGIDLRPQFADDMAVDRDSPGKDHFLRLPAGCHTMRGQDSLKPFHCVLLTKMSGPLPRSPVCAMGIRRGTSGRTGYSSGSSSHTIGYYAARALRPQECARSVMVQFQRHDRYNHG